MTPTEALNLMSIGLEPKTPDEGRSGDAREVKSERLTKPLASAANSGNATRPFESDSPQVPSLSDLGLIAMTDPGIGWAIGQLHNIFKRSGEKYEMPMNTPTPKFKPNPDFHPLDPFACVKGDDEHFGTYITREDSDIEVVLEVISFDEEGPNFGNAFTVRGSFLDLEPEELERIAAEWRDVMGQRAEREARENARNAEY